MKHMVSMKRVFSLTLVIMLLAMAAVPAFAKSKPKGAYVVITTGKYDRLRVHDSPWGNVTHYLKRGSVVVYKSSKSGWWKVSFRGGSGYVDKSYLTSVASMAGTKFTPVDNLWVYAKPKTSAAALGKLKAGKKVTIVGMSGSWVKISYKGYTGWTAAKYLKMV